MNSVSVSVSELFINFGQISKLCSFKGTHQGANPYYPFMSIPHQRLSHPPIPHSMGGIRPYANHFNSRGEMVQLASRPTVSMTPPLHVCAFSFFPSTSSNESNRPALRYDYASHQGATQFYSPNITTPDDYAGPVNKLNINSCYHQRLWSAHHHHHHHPLRNRLLSKVIPLLLIW